MTVYKSMFLVGSVFHANASGFSPVNSNLKFQSHSLLFLFNDLTMMSCLPISSLRLFSFVLFSLQNSLLEMIFSPSRYKSKAEVEVALNLTSWYSVFSKYPASIV